ncbi:Qat anti-phage system TatD family nuclease QatD [Arthrobacter sp. SD76]|uniref:Qat anti-phage system TatD family nuclease QatD n=1 Tax=Arthrobacter sp. SD76 TaxID=3415007 RepID=UPI003C721D00
MIDFHCHLDLFPNPREVAAEVQRRGAGVLSVTTTPSAWPGTSRLGQDRPAIRTALGLHPQIAAQRKQEIKLFERYLPETQYVGEVGLDGSPELRASWPDQQDVFRHILQACSDAGNKVLSIHSRRAVDPVLDLLEKYKGDSTFILHWFSGNQTQLKRAVDLGCWFSVGPSMLAGAKGKALVAKMPKNRVLLETDGPFAQYRQSALRPWDVNEGCSLLVDVWDESQARVEDQIRNNERLLLQTVS